MSDDSKEKRSNLWICVVYPGDSLPKNYEDIIKSWHLPVLCSPIHDADKNADSTEKKKHIHIMIDFGSGQNKSFDQVKSFTDQLKGTVPWICHSRSAMIRYFIHLDNPEKHQYSIDDFKKYGGFDFKGAFDSFTSEDQLYRFLEDIIYDNAIFNYAVLLRYLNELHMNYEAMFLRKHSLHFKALIDGQYHLIQSGKQIITSNECDITKYVKFKESNQ